MVLTLWNTPTSLVNVYYDTGSGQVVVFDKRTNSKGFQVGVYYIMAILIVTFIAYWYNRM